MAEKTEKKVTRNVRVPVDIYKVIQLYELIQNQGIEMSAPRLLDFIKRKKDDEEIAVFFENILTKIVDIANSNRLVRMNLATKLSPVKVSAQDIYDRHYGGQTHE
jgi:hypothetical protein